MVVVHDNHGKGVREGISDISGACFPNRYPHAILGYHTGTGAGLNVLSKVTGWAIKLQDEVHGSGFELDGGLPSFVPPDRVNVEGSFGLENARRLRALKARVDPGIMFSNKGLGELS